MKNEIEIKTAFWSEAVARIEAGKVEGIDEAMEIYEMDVSVIDAMQSRTYNDEDVYDAWVEFMDEVFNVINEI